MLFARTAGRKLVILNKKKKTFIDEVWLKFSTDHWIYSMKEMPGGNNQKSKKQLHENLWTYKIMYLEWEKHSNKVFRNEEYSSGRKEAII